jgi:hypothetical protein
MMVMMWLLLLLLMMAMTFIALACHVQLRINIHSDETNIARLCCFCCCLEVTMYDPLVSTTRLHVISLNPVVTCIQGDQIGRIFANWVTV